MSDAFDRLFGSLHPSMTRNEDGSLALNRLHPEVQKLIAAVRSCYEAGDTVEEIEATVMRGFEEGLRRAREATDGR
jgi:hypothetical protein